MGYICEARLEAGVDVWRDREPDAGCVLDGLLVAEDPGTVFRSGAMLDSLRSRDALNACASLDRKVLTADRSGVGCLVQFTPP